MFNPTPTKTAIKLLKWNNKIRARSTELCLIGSKLLKKSTILLIRRT